MVSIFAPNENKAAAIPSVLIRLNLLGMEKVDSPSLAHS